MRKSLNLLIEQALAALPDNTAELITPEKVRTMFTDFLDTLQPTYGALSIATKQQVLNTSPAIVVGFQAVDISIPPDFICDAALGTIKRELTGAFGTVPKLNTRFTINGDFIAPAGHDITLTLYANGVATPWQQSITGNGVANYSTFAFSGLDRIDVATTYDLRARSSNNGSTVTWENFIFICENIPIRDFSIPAQMGVQYRGVRPFPNAGSSS